MQELIQSSSILKRYLEYSKEELLIMRNYINLNLYKIIKKTHEEKGVLIDFRAIKSCLNENYDYTTFVLNNKQDIDTVPASTRQTIKFGDTYSLCNECKLQHCIKSSVINFVVEIDRINEVNNTKLEYLDVLDFILERRAPKFENVPEPSFFGDIDLVDLLRAQVLLEGEFINMISYDENTKIAKFNMLDITSKNDEEYYINIIYNFYKSNKPENILEFDLNKKDELLNKEKQEYNKYVCNLAAYYKYLIEIEKIDIIAKLRTLLDGRTVYKDGIMIRSHYFIYRFAEKVKNLPFPEESKNKVLDIFNYILNWNFKKVPYVPINLLIYSNDRESVENLGDIIGDYMWYFGYLPSNTRTYHEYMNNVLMDIHAVNKLFYTQGEGGLRRKVGVMYFHNFENILCKETLNQNLILNIFTDELSKNNSDLCTIIYGEKSTMDNILSEYPKLNNLLFNIKLDIDELKLEDVYRLLIERLRKTEIISEEVEKKIHSYIKATYHQSEVKNMEYIKKLYNILILNKNSRFDIMNKNELKAEDVPDVYNVRNLPEVMKDLNELVGLKEIKGQINDLVALLKFNQKANIDVSKFNLHMMFTGNPGTGKTTVARLISDILYNLGYIEKNKLVEVSAKDLIANYVGQTAGKTFNIMKSAFGGVLFIDEAYSITDSQGGFGDESLSTIIKTMEDYRDRLVIIFAGYKDEMEKFVTGNPGLSSRIGYQINFEDYTVDELIEIFMNLVAKNNLQMEDSAKDRLREIIENSIRVQNFGNARYINNIFQKALVNHAKNVDADEKLDLYKLTEEDLKENLLATSGKSKRPIGFMSE